MDLPLSLKSDGIDDSFKNSRIYLFKNKNHDVSAAAHYHIALQTKDSQYMVLNMITSKVEKRIAYYTMTNKSLVNSVVLVSNENIDILSTNSCIDCNQPMYLTKEEINALVEDDITYIDTNIDINLKQTIVDAILSSSMVSDDIKDSL